MRTRRRTGFTLLEVILALMLTAVSVTIAGSALRTATVARERIAEHRDTLEREGRLRAMLTDMLRHAPSAESVDEPLLRVRRTPTGSTELVFLSQGVQAPFGTGRLWRVSLRVADAGVVLDAQPIGAAVERTSLHATVGSLHALSVRLLEHGGGIGGAQWREDWPLVQSRPASIAIGFGDERAHPPLVVALDPLATLASRR
ncbi:MAG: prepilin-type N-terminal cleavage/methylation domain-containing protein [Gemmatimonadaceae bacterium]|nr:prepilin-type N-terminal cleavage/methylation domain-containing protein [Gemmatimonadaceae bacterium]